MENNIIEQKFNTIIELTRVDENVHQECRDMLMAIKLKLFKLKLSIDITIFGSYSRETAINTSDFDILFCLLLDIREYSPKSIMNYLLSTLKTQFRSPEYKLYIDYPAIVLEPKGMHVKFDLIPCSSIEQLIGSNREAVIPVDDYHYMRINIDYQNKYIFGLIGKNGFALNENAKEIKQAINLTTKLFKFWKSCHSLNFNIPSFYFETVLSNTWKGLENKSIQENFMYGIAALKYLAESGIIIDQYARITRTPSTHPRINDKEVIHLIQTTFKNCRLALHDEYSGKTKKSIQLWDIVFNGNFPK